MLLASSLLSLALCQTPAPVAPAPDRAGSQEGPAATASRPTLRPLGRRILAARPILADARVPTEVRAFDADKIVERLASLGADTCVFALDEHDRRAELVRFLPKAKAAGLAVWVAVRTPMQRADSAPHKGDYQQWAKDIARMAKDHDNLVAMLFQELDHGRNLRFIPPGLVKELRATLHAAGVNLVASLFEPGLGEGLDAADLDAVVALWAHPGDLRNLASFLAGARTRLPEGKLLLGGLTLATEADAALPDPQRLAAILRSYLHRTDGAYLGGFPLEELDQDWRKLLVATGDVLRAARDRPAGAGRR